MKTDNTAHRSNITVARAAAFSLVRMGLIWAAGWGLVGVLIVTFLDPSETIDDLWVPHMGMLGFVSGVVFSVVLWIAEGRRRIDELSLPRSGAWGAVVGLLLGLFPAAVVATGLATPAVNVWIITAVILGSTTLLCTVSAVGSAWLFQKAAPRRIPAGPGPEG